jgi:hypothetical protein
VSKLHIFLGLLQLGSRKMLIVMPASLQRIASRIVSRSVRGSGGYIMKRLLPSKCAVGNPSVISIT